MQRIGTLVIALSVLFAVAGCGVARRLPAVQKRMPCCALRGREMPLREGRVIFSGTDEEFVQSEDPYIQKFISGREMEPNQTQ